MALTVGPQRLGLHNGEAASSTKSVVLVKLTDSALGAIAQFLRHRSAQNCKPTIQFQQNSGTISIPIGNDGKQAKFSFSLTSNDDINGLQGSFECLQSTRSSGLDSLGPIQDKLQVHAADDSYQRFGEKMVEVKKENEKRSTVFIDRQGGAGQKLVRKQPAQSIQNKFQTTHRDRGGSSMNRIPPAAGSSSNPSDVLSGSHPLLDRYPPIKSNSYPKSQHQNNSEVMKRPLRERIVHLLAVRPFKKPELLLRINRDGIREKDKHNITPILKQVSTMKDNTYHLLRHIWNDVSEDWPFYTEEDRQSFRRRKPQNLTPPGSDGSTGSSISSGHSSSSSHPASPQPPSSLKRGGNGFYDGPGGGGGGSTSSLNGPMPKKVRVSNYMRPPEMGVGGKSPLLTSSRSPSSQSNGRSPLNESNGRAPVMEAANNDGKVSGWLMLNGGQRSSSSPAAHKFGGGGQVITPASSPDSQESSSESSTTAPPDMQIDQSNAKDYLVQFVPIANSEQRRLYKAEFNKNYNLYRRYHNYLEGVSRKFTQLESQLKQEQEGSDNWKKLKLKIWEEYLTSKKDVNYIRTRREFQYLHDKLAHIKRLVHDYDTKAIASDPS